MSRYKLVGGNTYSIKEDLKAHACKFNGKFWETPPISKDSQKYLLLKSLAEAVGADFVKVPETAKDIEIDRILFGKNK